MKQNMLKEIKQMQQDPIISFNVGGIIYRVSRNLLLQYPNTMLHMAASDMEINNNDAPIMIQRDGHRFQYGLDWMLITSCSWELPASLDCEAFYTDMEYFGFRVDQRICVPLDVKYVDGVQFHIITWDICRPAPGFFFESNNRLITFSAYHLIFYWQHHEVQ
jgi:BTB/POZ domain